MGSYSRFGYLTMILVIGNGESRINLNLNEYASRNVTIGCNAIYRDLHVNHLICCDQSMMREALSAISSDTLLYVRAEWYYTFKKLLKHKNIRKVPDIPNPSDARHDNPNHWGSGAYALLVAAMLEDSHIAVVGFDLYGKGELVNNVYKDTVNYTSSQTRSVDPSDWIYHISKIFKNFPNKTFIILNTNCWKIPDAWNLPNVTFAPLNKIQDYLQIT